MKKLLLMLTCVVTFFIMTTVSASALTNDMVRVGLRSGDTAPFSANLELARGEGYSFGWFDEELEFEEIGWTDETAISMTAAGDIYVDYDGNYTNDEDSDYEECMGRWHIELEGFEDFDEAQDWAWEYDGGYPAYIDGEFVVRIGCFEYEEDAEDWMYEWGLEDEAWVVESSRTGVLVTRTRSTEVLFEFDCSGDTALGVMPYEEDGEPSTWFKGYKYGGGFYYPRSGSGVAVINVVHLEDYVKGVVPYEMNKEWPIEALMAQAVCARTYVSRGNRHSGFDVCGNTCCQLYNGHGSGGAMPSENSDRAVERTEGECMYYDDELLKTAVYHSASGGYTEDCYYVWGTDIPYLKGVEDIYESSLEDIPNYEWEVTYTDDELTWILQEKGYDVGDIEDVYIEEYTPNGNVYKVTFVHDYGELTVKGDTCRTIFYSSTLNKSVKSLRFDINGSSSGVTSSGGKKTSYYVNDEGDKLSSLSGVAVLSGSGEVSYMEQESVSVLTADGLETLKGGSSGKTSKPSKGSQKRDGEFVITGSGSGHNVGMSQRGAYAMAMEGFDYEEILEFYFTDIEIY